MIENYKSLHIYIQKQTKGSTYEKEIDAVEERVLRLIKDSKGVPEMMDKSKHPRKKLLIVDRLIRKPNTAAFKSSKIIPETNTLEKPKRFLKSTNRRVRIGTLLLCKCGKEFTKKHSKQIYCSNECGVEEILLKGKLKDGKV